MKKIFLFILFFMPLLGCSKKQKIATAAVATAGAATICYAGDAIGVPVVTEEQLNNFEEELVKELK